MPSIFHAFQVLKAWQVHRVVKASDERSSCSSSSSCGPAWCRHYASRAHKKHCHDTRAHSACLGVFTEVQARPIVQDGLSTVLASKVTPTFVQHEKRRVTIQWSQNLRSVCTRVEEVPSPQQWMKQLPEPQQNTLGRAVRDGRQGLHSQVWGTARSTICPTTRSETLS